MFEWHIWFPVCQALLQLQVKEARLITASGAVEMVAADSLKVGDMVQLLPGDRVPVDGFVVEGKSTIDESMLTGESAPVLKEAQSLVTRCFVIARAASDVRRGPVSPTMTSARALAKQT